MVGMANAAQILAIEKAQAIAAMLSNPNFCADDVIDVGRSRAAFTDHAELAERLLEENDRDRVLAPVL